MARSDAIGFFWEDRPVVKVLKEAPPKRTPPERTWERPDYLPGLAEAQAFQVEQFTDLELQQAAYHKERLVFDVECYENYFLVAFQSVVSKKVTYVEMTPMQLLDRSKLHWIMDNFCLISFNGINYDMPIIALALAGKSNAVLKNATNQIILMEARPSDVLRSNKTKKPNIDHIDLIEVAPLQASLKIYGGRLHVPKMQDLPFPHETVLSKEQIDIVRWYCVNDLCATRMLYDKLHDQIQLRETMSREYKMDLRSKSDAQVAEAVIAEEVGQLNGSRAQRPIIEPGTTYYYKIPHFLRYQTPLMQKLLELIRQTPFIISENGTIGMPPQLDSLEIRIADGVYRMGIGGLHSSEKNVTHVASETVLLKDRDVTSYYPQIILNQELYPQHLGRNFLHVYQRLVDRRLEAKRSGNKIVADSLKITVNGSYGKLGSPYSILYAPDLLVQVTITGQLSLLMLIERLELHGFSCLSANTDGVVVACCAGYTQAFNAIVQQWERDTNFTTEETQYSAVYSRDVNNYIAVKKDGTTKLKGAYGKADLSKNPTNTICVDALIAFLTKQVPIEQTIQSCQDIRKFVSVRKVNGGAVKAGEYLGKSIRWYYATGIEGEIIYAQSGNKVPLTDGAKPLLQLPESFPADVDYDWYIKEAEKMLSQFQPPVKTQPVNASD